VQTRTHDSDTADIVAKQVMQTLENLRDKRAREGKTYIQFDPPPQSSHDRWPKYRKEVDHIGEWFHGAVPTNFAAGLAYLSDIASTDPKLLIVFECEDEAWVRRTHRRMTVTNWVIDPTIEPLIYHTQVFMDRSFVVPPTAQTVVVLTHRPFGDSEWGALRHTVARSQHQQRRDIDLVLIYGEKKYRS
jgi:hypothetical protein